jgi:hypothetical protein
MSLYDPEIEILSNEAGTVTAIILPDASTEAYGAFMRLLLGARLYYLGTADRTMVNFTDVLIQRI